MPTVSSVSASSNPSLATSIDTSHDSSTPVPSQLKKSSPSRVLHHICTDCKTIRSENFHANHPIRDNVSSRNFCSTCAQKRIERCNGGNEHFCHGCGSCEKQGFPPHQPLVGDHTSGELLRYLPRPHEGEAGCFGGDCHQRGKANYISAKLELVLTCVFQGPSDLGKKLRQGASMQFPPPSSSRFEQASRSSQKKVSPNKPFTHSREPASFAQEPLVDTPPTSGRRSVTPSSTNGEETRSQARSPRETQSLSPR